MSSIAGEVAGKIKQVQAEKKAERAEQGKFMIACINGEVSPWSGEEPIYDGVRPNQATGGDSSWYTWGCNGDGQCIQQRQDEVDAAVRRVAEGFRHARIDEPPPSLKTWSVTYEDSYSTYAVSETYTTLPGRPTVFHSNTWAVTTGKWPARVVGWGYKNHWGALLVRNLNKALNILVIHEYQWHIHPEWSDLHVMMKTTQIFEKIYGYNPFAGKLEPMP